MQDILNYCDMFESPENKISINKLFCKIGVKTCLQAFRAYIIQTVFSGVTILCRATSTFWHSKRACHLSIHSDNLVQKAELIGKRNMLIIHNSCKVCSQSQLWSSDWPVCSSRIFEHTIYFTYPMWCKNPEDFHLILLPVWHINNFVSNLRTIEHEHYILCQFLHTVLS